MEKVLGRRALGEADKDYLDELAGELGVQLDEEDMAPADGAIEAERARVEAEKVFTLRIYFDDIYSEKYFF